MLRVCGITYDHTMNYGSCLQAYALQKAVEDVHFADGEGCSYSLIPIGSFLDWPSKKTVKRTVMLPMIRFYRKQFLSFEKKYMHFAAVRSQNELPSLNKDYDAFVCGSDVIWSDSFNYRCGAFFLDFAEKYKFSYAASFGKAELTDDYLRFAGEKISRLNAVSVRESSAVQIAGQFTDKPVKVVSDPVLLVNREAWDKIAAEKIHHKPYIFIYATHLNNTIKQYLEQLKAATGLQVIWAVTGRKQAIKQGMLQVQKPQEWLGLLRDAAYVVTNSFHCTAFSVMFHKKFFTVVNGEKDKGINVRMNDFLNSVGLADRIFSSVPEQLDLSEIDFTGADQKIAALREESLAFLRENLEAAYREKQKAESKETEIK